VCSLFLRSVHRKKGGKGLGEGRRRVGDGGLRGHEGRGEGHYVMVALQDTGGIIFSSTQGVLRGGRGGGAGKGGGGGGGGEWGQMYTEILLDDDAVSLTP
jgi:hypothetical protein